MKFPALMVAGATGVAIFSMFFGSGNVVFPLILGQITGEQIPWALLGLCITAVGAPLIGLLGSVLFEGDCKQFFYRMGKTPGYIVVIMIIALMGPVGAMPRCFIVSYGAVQPYFPDLSLAWYSVLAGLVTLGLIARRDYIIPILGYVLSPLLILTLVVIIVAGVLQPGAYAVTHDNAWSATLKGLAVGYDTMDLLASIFFSVSIWMLLKDKLDIKQKDDLKTKLVPTYILASVIGGGLLGLIYVGLCYSAAVHHLALVGAPAEQVLASLALHLLGPQLAVVANIAVGLACITTVMSLAVAVVDVIHMEITESSRAAQLPLSYNAMMLIVMIITVIFTNLGFSAMMQFLHPIMEIGYPAVIVLTICNILYKLYGFAYVKLPVYTTLGVMFIWKLVA